LLPPSRQNQWHWEFVARHSGATVPDSHGVPRHLYAFTGGLGAAYFQRTTDFKAAGMEGQPGLSRSFPKLGSRGGAERAKRDCLSARWVGLFCRTRTILYAALCSPRLCARQKRTGRSSGPCEFCYREITGARGRTGFRRQFGR
jgi:hypothetical protein